MPSVQIIVPGDPQGKGRPRSRIVQPKGRAGFVSHYTPTKTRQYESLIRELGALAMKAARLAPFEGPLTMDMCAFMAVPESWPAWRRDAALAGDIVPTVKPDFDNLMKTIDGLNGVCFKDDVQIVGVTFDKYYAAEPSVLITLHPLAGKAPAQVASKQALAEALRAAA